MYPKCNKIKCEWHMGDNHIKGFAYLDGTCYNSTGKQSMFCPLNTNSVLTKEKCTCRNPRPNLIKKDNRCLRCYGIIKSKEKPDKLQ